MFPLLLYISLFKKKIKMLFTLAFPWAVTFFVAKNALHLCFRERKGQVTWKDGLPIYIGFGSEELCEWAATM